MKQRFSKFTVDGHEYQLAYDFNTLADCEDETGCNLLLALETQGQNTAKQVRGLIFAMTRETHPALTMRDAGILVRIDTIGAVTEAIGEACAMAVSEEFLEAFRKAVAEANQESEAGDQAAMSDETPADESPQASD